MSTVKEQLIKITENLALMYDMVLEAYKYMPVIYEQRNINDGNASYDKYTIRTHLTYIPTNSLLYLLPRYTSSKDTVYLEIIMGDESRKQYTVYLEDTDGTPMKAGAHTIIANRLAIFRFSTNIVSTEESSKSESVILTNNPHYNTVSTTNLHVADQAYFTRMPILMPEGTEDTDNISKGREFVLYADYLELLNRVKTLEKQFVIGSEDVSEVADTLEEGQIYLKVEEIESDD